MLIDTFYTQMSQRLQLLSQSPAVAFAPDTSFISTGLIDSISIVEVITFVEQYWEISVDPSELSVENFDSMAAIAAYAERKRTSAQ
jgi:acyl carrier protein